MDSRKYLSADEREALESTLSERIESNTRDCAMILTALHTGARASELLALTWDDIDTRKGSIQIKTLKGGNPREVIIPKAVRRALDLLREQSPKRPFAVSYSRLTEIWHLYRPARKPFHSLRHSFAMRAYDRSKDIRFVKYALGHRNIQNTMVYADHAYSISEFKKLMRIR